MSDDGEPPSLTEQMRNIAGSYDDAGRFSVSEALWAGAKRIDELETALKNRRGKCDELYGWWRERGETIVELETTEHAIRGIVDDWNNSVPQFSAQSAEYMLAIEATLGDVR